MSEVASLDISRGDIIRAVQELRKDVGQCQDGFLVFSALVQSEGAQRAELEKRIPDISGLTKELAYAWQRVREIESTVRELAAKDGDRHEFAAAYYDGAKLMGEVFGGPLTPDISFKKGMLYQWQGGVFLALRDGRGAKDMPGRQTVGGDDPVWALFSARGAAGPAGPQGENLTPAGYTVLTDGATVNWNLNTPIGAVTLGDNRTLAVSNLSAGGTYILHVIQDGTGSRTLTWPASVKWPGNTAPTLTTTANARDIFSFTSDGTYLFGSYVLGYPL